MKLFGMRDIAQFFEQINLYSKGLDSVRELAEQRKYIEALHEYRELLETRIPKKTESPIQYSQPEMAELLLENKLSLLNSEPVDLGEPIDWFLSPNGDKQWQSHLGYFYFTFYLLDAYEKNGEIKYLNKWMSIYNDFLEHHRWGAKGLEYDVSLPVYVNEKGYKHGGEGRMPGYLGGSWIGLATATRIDHWISALGRVIDDENVPDIFIANVIYSLATDHVHVSLNNARRYTPNQFVHCASALIHFSRVFNEFKIAPAAYYVGMDRLEEALELCVLPDGTDPEQSFNYNAGVVGRIYEIVSLFDGIHNKRVDGLKKKAEQRCFFLSALLNPLHQFPAVAKSQNHKKADTLNAIKNRAKQFPTKEIDEIVNAAEGKGECSFLSVAFPYGGYYIFRSGWNQNDNYLFFKTSRHGMGHSHEDCNSLTLTAYGQNLLIDCGNYDYSDNPASEKINDYFFSSFAHNTVCVNNMSQNRKGTVSKNRDMVTEDWHDCEAYYDYLCSLQKLEETEYHMNDMLQYAEGYYKDGYGKNKFDALHHRQVFSVDHKCYLVVDRIKGGNTCQVNWNLSADCSNTSFSENCLFTKAGDVNLEILHLGAELSGEIFNGSEEPFAGWYCYDYGKKKPSDHVSLTWENNGLLVSVLMPYQKEKPVIQVDKNKEEIIFSVIAGNVKAECFFTEQHSKVTVSKNNKKETFER